MSEPLSDRKTSTLFNRHARRWRWFRTPGNGNRCYYRGVRVPHRLWVWRTATTGKPVLVHAWAYWAGVAWAFACGALFGGLVL